VAQSEDVRQQMDLLGLTELIGSDGICATLADAVALTGIVPIDSPGG
jgi:hypothetical protein